MNVNAFLQKDYENETAFRTKKTNPKQTQSKPILEAMNVNFCAKGYYESKPTFAANNQNSSSPLPSVVGRGSSPKADKIALKIYPFGIDCPIVLKGLKLTDFLCHSSESGNPVKNVDSVSSTK